MHKLTDQACSHDPFTYFQPHPSLSLILIVIDGLGSLVGIPSPPLILTYVLQRPCPRLLLLLCQIPFQLPLRLVGFRISFL